MGSNQTHQPVRHSLSDIWIHSDEQGLKCPNCQANLILIQTEEIQDINNPYHTYDSIIECPSCSFHTRAISYSLLGAVDTYDMDHLTINGWLPSGSRIQTTVEHVLDYQLLKELRQSESLVEFLIVDDHAIQVIG